MAGNGGRIRLLPQACRSRRILDPEGGGGCAQRRPDASVGVSEWIAMLAYSVAITFAYHNFVRFYQTPKRAPAVAAGIVRRRWKIEDLVELADVPQFAGK